MDNIKVLAGFIMDGKAGGIDKYFCNRFIVSLSESIF